MGTNDLVPQWFAPEASYKANMRLRESHMINDKEIQVNSNFWSSSTASTRPRWSPTRSGLFALVAPSCASASTASIKPLYNDSCRAGPSGTLKCKPEDGCSCACVLQIV